MKTNKNFWSILLVVILSVITGNAYAAVPSEALVAICEQGQYKINGTTTTATSYIAVVDMEKLGQKSGGKQLLLVLKVPNLPSSKLPSLKESQKMKGKFVFKGWKDRMTDPLTIATVNVDRNNPAYLYFLLEQGSDYWIENWLSDERYDLGEEIYYYTDNGMKVTYTEIPPTEPMKFFKDFINLEKKCNKYWGIPDEYSRSLLAPYF